MHEIRNNYLNKIKCIQSLEINKTSMQRVCARKQDVHTHVCIFPSALSLGKQGDQKAKLGQLMMYATTL